MRNGIFSNPPADDYQQTLDNLEKENQFLRDQVQKLQSLNKVRVFWEMTRS